MTSSPYDNVLHWAAVAGDRIAIVEGAVGHTYGAVALQLRRFSTFLRRSGVREGMIVGVECESRRLALLVMLACESLGAAHLPLGAADLAPDSPLAGRCDLICAQHVPAAEGLPPILALTQETLVAILSLDLEVGEGAPAPRRFGPETAVRISRTSGTTGAGKLMIKRRRYYDEAMPSYDWCLKPVDGDHTYLCFYSPSVGGVFFDLVRALMSGNRIVFATGLSDILGLEDLGSAYAFLLLRDAETLAGACRDLGRNLGLHYIDITGAAIPRALYALFEAHLTPDVCNVYSSNEAGCIAAMRSGVGRVCPGVEIRIVDDAGAPVAPGQVGRILVRGPMVISGYLWDEALNAESFDDGWLRMSDLGRVPEPGGLEVLGRVDDMLNIGGEKIAPYPIEQRLRAIDGVSDAVVLRIENDNGVGRLCVVLERPEGSDDGRLREAAAQVMAAHTRSFALRLEAAFPRTETGKVRRNLLQPAPQTAPR